MPILRPDDAVAAAAVAAVRAGDHAALRALLDTHPRLATARIGTDPVLTPGGTARTLLHIATDWPGHRPGVAETIRMLADAGADVDAPFLGTHRETALHWAASADDIAALDALLDAGASVDAPGGVIAGGTPLDDAVAFGNRAAADRLVQRGAATGLHHAAALGLAGTVRDRLAAGHAGPEDLDAGLWHAGHGGQPETAELLLAAGADPRWTAPWDGTTAADAADRAGAPDLAARLRAARSGAG
jgi:ankyrin repeat protein